jgi:hypothetical protein
MTPGHVPTNAADRPSAAEVTAVVRLVRAQRARLVNVGHGRDARSVACARAFIAAWQAAGGEIGTAVSWPPAAASWLRPAGRLAAGAPDAWVVADVVTGWRNVGPRLVATGSWRAGRTVAFASLADPTLPALAGHEPTDELSGALPDGSIWTFRDGRLIVDRAPMTELPRRGPA